VEVLDGLAAGLNHSRRHAGLLGLADIVVGVTDAGPEDIIDRIGVAFRNSRLGGRPPRCASGFFPLPFLLASAIILSSGTPRMKLPSRCRGLIWTRPVRPGQTCGIGVIAPGTRRKWDKRRAYEVAVPRFSQTETNGTDLIGVRERARGHGPILRQHDHGGRE